MPKLYDTKIYPSLDTLGDMHWERIVGSLRIGMPVEDANGLPRKGQVIIPVMFNNNSTGLDDAIILNYDESVEIYSPGHVPFLMDSRQGYASIAPMPTTPNNVRALELALETLWKPENLRALEDRMHDEDLLPETGRIIHPQFRDMMYDRTIYNVSGGEAGMYRRGKRDLVASLPTPNSTRRQAFPLQFAERLDHPTMGPVQEVYVEADEGLELVGYVKRPRIQTSRKGSTQIPMNAKTPIDPTRKTHIEGYSTPLRRTDLGTTKRARRGSARA